MGSGKACRKVVQTWWDGGVGMKLQVYSNDCNVRKVQSRQALVEGGAVG